MNKSKTLLKAYFKENSIVQANIKSYNNFIDNELQKIIEENQIIEPAIIPHNVDEFKIKLDKIWVTKPEIIEADGSKRPIYPMEARLRKLSYSAPVFIEVSAHINGIQRDSFTTQIGSIPIMLKSKYCHLNGLSKEELIELGEDPDDTGGYFIINAIEKAVVTIEDLGANKFLVEKASTGVSEFVGKLFSEKGSYKIPHTIEKLKDGIFYLTFTRVRRVPLVIVLKALGMLNDQEIMRTISKEEQFDDAFVNLFEFVNIKSEEEALDTIAKRIGITQSKDVRIQRMREILDKYLLPHIGVTKEDRLKKAQNICKMLKKFILISTGKLDPDDKDHYANKRLKLAGDLLADLFRVNLKMLINDLLYNFQRTVKRGKFPSIKVIIREKLLTSRIYTAMATGNWVGGRKGVSQRMERLNYLQALSHLQRIVSPLSASQENFEARELHATHMGRLCPVETPEGTNIGLRKNMALLASVTHDSDEIVVLNQLKDAGMVEDGESEVYLNGKYVGEVNNPQDFVFRIIQERRKGTITGNLNIAYDDDTNEVYVECSRGRARRPLIVVSDGIPALTENHLKQLDKGEITWSDLIKQGILEYLDATEEENALVAFTESELTPDHTHLEISPLAMLGLTTSLVPFSNYSQSTRALMGAKSQKQAMGLYISNYVNRMDMDVNLLHTPQLPIVESFMNDISEYEKHPNGQNIVVAIMSYKGYNMDDAIILNKGSIERGLARSTYYRPSVAEELRYQGGLVDEISIPDKEVRGYRSERDYRFLEEDGIIYPEARVAEDDVVIGKTSPPRFLSGMDEYVLASNVRRESSVAIKHGERGIVDFVLITENEEGNKLVQVRVRDQMIPEIGDKFTSRHGQKGVVGLIVPQEDMPYTASGIVPDLLFSPHGIPTRMTVSHLLELIGGKVGSLAGRMVNGTTFESETEEDLRKELLSLGFRDNGTETMYNGLTGEQLQARIFIGNMYYLKLKHLVANKLHSRARGPIQLLTRQPTEGRAKEGGLRLGEMEKDTFVAHGASLLLKERFDSDRVVVPVCENCGIIAIHDEFKNRSYCPLCGENSEVNNIEMSYAFKLMLDEFKSLGVYPQLKLKNKY